MPGCPTQAGGRLPAGRQGPLGHVPLAGPGAAQLDQVPVGIGQVERGAHRRRDPDRGRAAVPDPGVARDDRLVPEDRVRQGHLDPTGAIDEHDLDAGRLSGRLDVGRRQAADRRLAREDPVAGVLEPEDPRAVGLLDRDGRHPEVAAAFGRVFEGDRVVEPVAEAGEAAPAKVPIRVACGQRRTEVELADRAILEDPDQVADPAVGQVKLASSGVPLDRHRQRGPIDSIVHDQR